MRWQTLTTISFSLFVVATFGFYTSSYGDTANQLESKSESQDSFDDKELGQLLLIGFKGTSVPGGLQSILEEVQPGGILLFGRNIRSAVQVSRLCFDAQNISIRNSKLPLLIAIDQEGGNVIRIRNSPTLPSALAIAQTGDLNIAKKSGLATGRLLKTLGINVNLAPVVDVSDPNTDRFLGTRSFGGDADLVSSMTVAVAEGLQEMNVLPVAKHFPGHGNASGDSHLGAAHNNSSLEKLKNRDLRPYIALSKNLKTPWGIMLAHVSFPNIDPSGLPATFSKKLVTDILRNTVGGQVEDNRNLIVITDDIEMAGAATEKNYGKRAVRAVKAGADMVMIAWNRQIQKLVLNELKAAIKSGELPITRVQEALGRIKKAKAVYALPSIRLASAGELKKNLMHKDFLELGEAVLRSAIEHRKNREPANTAAAGRILQSADPVIVLSSRYDFLTTFRKKAIGYKVIGHYLRPSKIAAISRSLVAHPESPIIVYVSGRQVAAYVDSLSDDIAARTILVNADTRAVLKKPDRYRDIFDVHFRHPMVGAATAEVYLELKGSGLNPTHRKSSVSFDFP